MPLLKWVGGKSQIMSDVLARFPADIQNYHEPFVGGGSVLLAMLDAGIEVKGTLYASDINPYLIHFYKTLQTQPDALLRAVRRIPVTTEGE
jgi:DNA adenine methylase